jgi:hypothetical protein
MFVSLGANPYRNLSNPKSLRVELPSSFNANEHEARLTLEILLLMLLHFLPLPPNMPPLRSRLLIMIRTINDAIQSGLGYTNHTVPLCIVSPPEEHHPEGFPDKLYSRPSCVYAPSGGVCENKTR